MSIRIRIIQPGTADTVPEEREFAAAEVSIGRAPNNDIVLADKAVSGNHAKIILGPKGQLYLVDLGSSNGTFIEAKRIEPDVQLPLRPENRIVIGNYLLTAALTDQEALATGHFKQQAKDDTANKNSKIVQSADYDEELQIKRNIHDALIERLDLRRKDILSLSETELRNRARGVIEQILIDFRWSIPSGLDREKLIKEVLDEALGLGPLEELLDREDCSEIMVNRYNQIYAEMEGKLQLTPYRFSSEAAVLGAIERILAPIGRRIDESSPMVDARLKDGSRVNAVIRPLALAGPCITIRKFSKDPLVIADLVRFGSMSQGMADFLKLAVENRLNIVISGGTGSGKTTLLNVISAFVPDNQRMITVEDAAELRLPQEHVISFETRPANLEGKGAIAIRDLVKNALRMRPDRIIVGECRGPETLDMLQAMNTGHDGSMTTGHSNSPEDMVRRLETMVLTAGLDLPVRAIREQIASAVNIILQQTRFSCGTRKVTAISEVVGMDYDEGVVQLQDIFLFKQKGYGPDGKVQGKHQATGYVPEFFRELQERGTTLDASVFSPGA